MDNSIIQPARLSKSDILVTLSDPSSPSAEAIRQLRTHIMARHVGQGHRALAICGASEGVGCTFVAANLAVALSQIGVNTLLIDADMRNPSVSKIFESEARKADITTALSRDISFNECIATDVLPSLSILYASASVPDAQELLAGLRFGELMDFCLREFDATIIDTPPANDFSDARRVSTVVGYSLVVARRNQSKINDIKVLTEQLRGDHAVVIGTVLNES